ncbi:matrixin family metalloprotease [Methanococcoides sp. SA1]|nr:matrixin family metalloprotease [Methanococcoides sp. SA1]
MAWKVISVIVVFFLVVLSFAFVFDNMKRVPVELKVNYLEPKIGEYVEYGAVPVFSENLRFNHDLISYWISEDCDADRRGDMIEAFSLFSGEVGVISFYENEIGADIMVGCSDEFIELGENLFAAGEGGPSRIINTSGFKVIEEGKIKLYNGAECTYPIVALHELCHVFGFDHSPDPKNIMYNTSDCSQRMSEDMKELMIELYAIEPLADAKVEDFWAEFDGKYLNFNISVLNEGMVDISDINLTILADEDVVDEIEMGKIEVGYGRILRVENVRVSRGFEKIEFVLDFANVVRELNEENNVVEVLV